ncbi:MAG: phosphoribosylglycinamide formyltransferase [Oscillibacter sp.]|nr:phosphoribosylglycinamide formyltransferase [Oscillibacter sp.]
MKRARIAVLVSGGGTNLESLLKAQEAGQIPHGEIVVALSSAAGAYALERANNHNVPGFAVPRKGKTQEEFEAGLNEKLAEYRVDMIVLAGFLSILSEAFVKQWPDRIVNVHPSLIPAFCGKGYYGLKVHEAALDRGVKVTGATVHLVNEIPDGGRILLQKAVEIQPDDTPEVLQRRVMEQAEWILLPRAAELVASGLAEEAARRPNKETRDEGRKKENV